VQYRTKVILVGGHSGLYLKGLIPKARVFTSGPHFEVSSVGTACKAGLPHTHRSPTDARNRSLGRGRACRSLGNNP
jgi:hypothetical protein